MSKRERKGESVEGKRLSPLIASLISFLFFFPSYPASTSGERLALLFSFSSLLTLSLSFSFSLPFIQQRRLAVFFQGHGRECRPMGEETSRRVADVAAAAVVAVVARVVATLTQERDGKAVKMKIPDF